MLPTGSEYAFHYHLLTHENFREIRHYVCKEEEGWWYIVIDWNPEAIARGFDCKKRFVYTMADKAIKAQLTEKRLTSFGWQLFFKKNRIARIGQRMHESDNQCTIKTSNDCTNRTTELHDLDTDIARIGQSHIYMNLIESERIRKTAAAGGRACEGATAQEEGSQAQEPETFTEPSHDHSADASKMVPTIKQSLTVQHVDNFDELPTPAVKESFTPAPPPPAPKPKRVPFSSKNLEFCTVRNPETGEYDLTTKEEKHAHTQPHAQIRAESKPTPGLDVLVNQAPINPKLEMIHLIDSDPDLANRPVTRDRLKQVVQHKALALAGDPVTLWQNQRARWGNELTQLWFTDAVIRWNKFLDRIKNKAEVFEWTSGKGMPSFCLTEAKSLAAQGFQLESPQQKADRELQEKRHLYEAWRAAKVETLFEKAMNGQRPKREAQYEEWIAEQAQNTGFDTDYHKRALPFEHWLRGDIHQWVEHKYPLETWKPTKEL